MKKIKFNAIDFLILIIVIAAIVSIAFRSGLSNQLAAISSKETIVYTVRIDDIQKESFDLIDIEDKLYSQKDDKYLGTIVEKDSRPAEEYVTLDTGEVVKTYYPNRIDVFLTVECVGRVTEEGCMLGGMYFVAAGKEIQACTDTLAFKIEVTDAYKK